MTETDTDPRTWNNATVRDLERSSIRAFMEESRAYLKGRVLDFGAGKQPYRDLVDGEYVPFEPGDSLGDSCFNFDAVMLNQVMQYVDDPFSTLEHLWFDLKPSGHLVMTYATNWDEVESSDLWRFTKTGMERLLKSARFEIVRHARRAEIKLGGFSFPLGYGVVATKA